MFRQEFFLLVDLQDFFFRFGVGGGGRVGGVRGDKKKALKMTS